MPKHVPGKHMLRHVLKHVPRHVLQHMPDKHMPEHMPGHLLEHVPQNRQPDPEYRRSGWIWSALDYSYPPSRQLVTRQG